MTLQRTTPWPRLGRTGLAALVILAALLGGCSATPSADMEPGGPGRPDDFDWYWDTVDTLRDEPGSYTIEVRFTNTSNEASAIPDCWAIPGPGRADAMTWEERPLVEAGETMWASGTVTFARRILEIDEVVCDREIASSYRR